MIIACDIDNVLNSLCEAVLSVYNEDADDNLKVEDITSYYIEEFVKPQYKKTFFNYFVDKRVWRRVKLIEDCQKYVAKLFNDGHEIIFLTSTEAVNIPKKARWLQRNFPFLNIRKCLFSCPKKRYMAGIDILIDDCLGNIGYKNTYKTIILTTPWNENFEVDNKETFRANNWKGIYSIIKEI